MNYFRRIEENGTRYVRVEREVLHSDDARGLGEGLTKIVREYGVPVIVDMRGVRYAHKDALIHMLCDPVRHGGIKFSDIKIINAQTDVGERIRGIFNTRVRVYGRPDTAENLGMALRRMDPAYSSN